MSTPESTPIPVYDVSGDSCFCHGVTNFCIANALAAMRSIKVVTRDDLSAMVNVLVYDNLYISGQVDQFDGKVTWCNFWLSADPDSTFGGPGVDSVLSDSKGNKVILRTREY